MLQDNITIWFAISAGMFSFLSPCILPLIPAYLAYLLGSSGKEIKEKKKAEKWMLFHRSLGFIIGFSIIFILLGTTATFLGGFLYEYQQIIRKTAGIFIIIFGLHIMGLIKLRFLYKEKRLSFLPKSKGFFPSIFVGMAFSIGWTPCVGPILASILMLAGTAETLGKGAVLLAAYSLGLGIPFLLVSLVLDYFSNFYSRFYKYINYVNKLGGILLILLGILLYFDRFASLSL